MPFYPLQFAYKFLGEQMSPLEFFSYELIRLQLNIFNT